MRGKYPKPQIDLRIQRAQPWEGCGRLRNLRQSLLRQPTDVRCYPKRPRPLTGARRRQESASQSQSDQRENCPARIYLSDVTQSQSKRQIALLPNYLADYISNQISALESLRQGSRSPLKPNAQHPRGADSLYIKRAHARHAPQDAGSSPALLEAPSRRLSLVRRYAVKEREKNA